MSDLIARLAKPLLSGLAALLLVSGCASTNNPRDPLEPINRAIYQVNDVLDKALMKPIATVYKTVIPRTRAHRRDQFLQQPLRHPDRAE